MKSLFKLIGNNWIKDNISIVILIPAAFGGLWQIFELASIGTPFIRFFSVSQLVSDGLLILFIIAWTYGVWRVIVPNGAKESDENSTESIENNQPDDRNTKGVFISVTDESFYKKRDGYILIAIMLVINLIVFKYAWWPEIGLPLLDKRRLSIMTIIGVVTGLTIFALCMKQSVSIFLEINNLKLNSKNKLVVNTTYFIYLFGSMFIIYSFFYFIRLFHDSFVLPENFKNSKYIECKIKANNKTIKSYDIEYFNDKYIFITITDKTDNKFVEVFKFEDFLENSACVFNDSTSRQ